ncbi:hypothetical protein GOP47_0018993 [Adiantum capillus-veneris]|uniref:Glutathione hydrolase n=1 Tax=Adiantum capillus-veneris TaxID=13818 RepID=A0A9D4Z9A0_ADICA|nr:hypothetical protein GOP47_0018993 [Adiantum capillus-veneris]
MQPCAATLITLLLVLVVHAGAHYEGGRSRVAYGHRGAVASDEGRCSAIGRNVMAKRGGNAVDACVSVALCLGVLNPGASGIGGGAFLLFRPANSTSAIAFDFREVAPAAASQNMYAENADLQLNGGLYVAVPGELAGLYLVWQQYGSLTWKSLVKPAIQLADNGFIVRRYLASALNASSASILADEGFREVFAPNGTLLKAGDVCFRKSLAKSLESIALHGPDAFYRGPIGESFVRDVRTADGILTIKDLNDYAVKIRDAIVHEVQGLTIYGMPPPSFGGACMAMVLNILAAYPDPFEAVRGPLGLHRIVEAFKHAFALRMNLGDPDFVDVKDVVSLMLNATYAAELQKLINDSRTYPPTYYGGRWNQLTDHGTSHFNIVDQDRNALSMTSTINYAFGAKVLSKSTGIVMNNEMGDFSLPSNDPAAARANLIVPYKRPMSSMAPSIIMKDGQFLAALGGSGGVKIITTTIQVFIERFWKGHSSLASISKPRVHHQLMPNVINYENWTTASGELIEEPEAVLSHLKSKGHNVTASAPGGISQLIVQRLCKQQAGCKAKGRLTAVSDLRKDGYPSAY